MKTIIIFIYIIFCLQSCSTTDEILLSNKNSLNEWNFYMKKYGYPLTKDSSIQPEGYSQKLWKFNGGYIRLVYKISTNEIKSINYELIDDSPKFTRFQKVMKISYFDVINNSIKINGDIVNINLNDILIPFIIFKDETLEMALNKLTYLAEKECHIKIIFVINSNKKFNLNENLKFVNQDFYSILSTLSKKYDFKFKCSPESIIIYDD